MKKHLLLLLGLAFSGLSVAQENLLDLRAEARVDYQREYVDGETVKANSGFKGKYLNIILSGTLNEHFSYAYRQRLNKAHSEQSFFDATDWVYLTYRPNEHWAFSAGKQVVNIGGYEYDRAPISIYFASEYWHHISCYQLGVSATYAFNGGRDKLTAQFCESPFRAHGDDMYACNLMWNGSHGPLTTLYSANLMEYLPGKFITYLALGHRLQMGEAALELDFMNRAASHQTYFFRDCSVVAELSWQPSHHFNLFGKVSYDVNRTRSEADYCVLPGTELTYVGGGLEYFPIKGSKDVRLHAAYAHSFGNNAPQGALQPKQDLLDVGLTWRVDFLSLKNPWKKK